MPPHNLSGPAGEASGDEAPGRTGFNFSTFFIKNPVTTLIMVLILVVLGVASFTQLPPDLMPNVEFPVVVVNTAYPGAAPAEVETLITKPIEDALAGLNGLDTLMSSSADGMSSVICQLQIGVSSRAAEDDIRDRVSAILYKLPTASRPPNYVTFGTTSLPICYYSVSGSMSDVALSTYVKDDIVPQLEEADGVATIQEMGNVEPDVEVAVNPDRLVPYGLSLPGIFSDIQAENYNLPGGVFDSRPRQMTVRTMGKFDSPQALSHLPISTPGGGVIELGDVATVRNSIKDPTTAAAVNGRQAIVLGIIKQTNSNVVATVAAVDSKIAELAPSLPQGIQIVKASDTSRFIKMSNDAVWEHLAMGAMLAVLVLFLFLRNWRVMIIAGLAIPLSILMAFTPMKLAGFTLNNVTMLGLSLVVGILVDDAVVDLENIFRHMENGESPIKAAIHATGEIQLAVTATSLTIVAVFLPMSFMTGMVGQFMSSFGATVTFAVLFSLLIARTLTPMLAAYLLKVRKKGHESRLEGDLSGRYPRLLRWSLRHRWVIIAVAIASFVGGLSLLRFIPTTFMADADRGEFYLRVQMPPGTPIGKTLATAEKVAAHVRTYPGVTQVITTVGSDGQVDDARVDVLLVDRSKRKLSDSQIAEEVRQAYATVPGYRVLADELSIVGGGMTQKPIDVQISGDDLHLIRHYGDRLAALMSKRPDLFADVETSLGSERSELRVIPDRVRMAQLGITASQLAETLLLATTGDNPNTMTVGNDEVDVWVRMDAQHRRHLTSLDSLPIMTPKGTVPLSALARTEIVGGYSVIMHRNRKRLVDVTANLPPGVSLGTDTTYLQKTLEPQLALPASLAIRQGGDAKQQRDAFAGFGEAMVLGVVMIYFVLALQFSSFAYPLVIMFSLPLSISGALAALLLDHQELSMMSLIGIIMLMGIVTKNAILIVDFILTMRERGYDRTEAVLRGAQVRMRPILMTTAAMVLGMMPIAFGIGAGSEFRVPMAVVVIGGLLTSTLLTLVVVPVGYTLVDDIKGFFGHLLRRRRELSLSALPLAEVGEVKVAD